MSGLFTVRITGSCSDDRIFYHDWSNCRVGLYGDFLVRDGNGEAFLQVIRKGRKRIVQQSGEDIGIILPDLYGRGATLFSCNEKRKIEEKFSIYHPQFENEGFTFKHQIRGATAVFSEDFFTMKLAFCFFRLIEEM